MRAVNRELHERRPAMAQSQDTAKTSRTGAAPRPPDELPYWVELWRAGGSDAVERVLARAVNAQLARAIFNAAKAEYPERRITLCKDGRIIADTRIGG